SSTSCVVDELEQEVKQRGAERTQSPSHAGDATVYPVHQYPPRDPCWSWGSGCEECGPEAQLVPRRVGQRIPHGCANPLPRAAPHPVVNRAERPPKRNSELRQ